MQNREWDAVVIGGGAAGLSAAQMLGRARRRTLVIDEGSPRNRFAAHMHGVLGHDGIEPQALLARGRDELDRYGVHVEKGAVADIRDEGAVLRLTRVDGTVDTARAVIIATGVRDELPSVAGLDELWGHSVLHCPYCHGFEVAGARLGVLATSALSIHQIELVRQWSAEVTAFTAAIEPLDETVRTRLRSRGIHIVDTPVTAVRAHDGALRAVQDAAGVAHEVDALFVAPSVVVDIAFADGLGLARHDEPGSPLAVDGRGATSHPRVWAAGNVAAPHGNVPVAMATGSMAGAAVNAALVDEDTEFAVAASARRRAVEWEQRYAERDSVWSGRVNAAVADVTADLEAGTALEIGCGEGADAVWLAERGWRVTAVDLSPTAIRRARAVAAERGLSDRLSFVVGSGADAAPPGTFDLVSASFLHSWDEDFPRIPLLRAAADRVAGGGHLLVVSHAAAPPWSTGHGDGHTPRLLPPEEELRLLALDPDAWEHVIVETRRREVTDPDGRPATLEDGILLLRRRPERTQITDA